MPRLLRPSLLAAALLIALPATAQAADGPQVAGVSMPSAIEASRDGKPPSDEATQPGRDTEPARARPSEALIRALIVLSSASGGRPFPLVPR